MLVGSANLIRFNTANLSWLKNYQMDCRIVSAELSTYHIFPIYVLVWCNYPTIVYFGLITSRHAVIHRMGTDGTGSMVAFGAT